MPRSKSNPSKKYTKKFKPRRNYRKRRTYVKRAPIDYNPLKVKSIYNDLSLEEKMEHQLRNGSLTINRRMTVQKYRELAVKLRIKVSI